MDYKSTNDYTIKCPSIELPEQEKEDMKDALDVLVYRDIITNFQLTDAEELSNIINQSHLEYYQSVGIATKVIKTMRKETVENQETYHNQTENLIISCIKDEQSAQSILELLFKAIDFGIIYSECIRIIMNDFKTNDADKNSWHYCFQRLQSTMANCNCMLSEEFHTKLLKCILKSKNYSFDSDNDFCRLIFDTIQGYKPDNILYSKLMSYYFKSIRNHKEMQFILSQVDISDIIENNLNVILANEVDIRLIWYSLRIIYKIFKYEPYDMEIFPLFQDFMLHIDPYLFSEKKSFAKMIIIFIAHGLVFPDISFVQCIETIKSLSGKYLRHCLQAVYSFLKTDFATSIFSIEDPDIISYLSCFLADSFGVDKCLMNIVLDILILFVQNTDAGFTFIQETSRTFIKSIIHAGDLIENTPEYEKLEDEIISKIQIIISSLTEDDIYPLENSNWRVFITAE